MKDRIALKPESD